MTLFTSDTDKNRFDSRPDRSLLRTARTYLFVSLFTAFFGAVYEWFSFGVYSYFMLYAFAVPLVLGTLPFLMMGMRSRAAAPPLPAGRLWHAGVAVLTVGCLFKGVLDIYGTESDLTPVYWIAGGALLAAALLRAAVKAARTRFSIRF